MSRFQSPIVLIFIINICFIVGTEEADRPWIRAWLDLNYNPEEVPTVDLNFEPEDLDEAPAEIILADPNSQIPEGGSSSSYSEARQYNMEKLFYESAKTWKELQSDPQMSDGKWKIMCDEMVKICNTEVIICNLRCKPEPYFKRWRRMRFEEFVNKHGNKGGLAPNFLLCNCGYYELVNGNLEDKKAHFGVKHYTHNDYFLLEIQKYCNTSVHIVRNIYTLNISP